MSVAATQKVADRLKTIVLGYLSMMGWNGGSEFEDTESGSKIGLIVSYDFYAYHLFIEIDPTRQRIEVYLYDDRKIPKDRLPTACLLTNHVNKGTNNGYLAALDVDSGFQFKQILDTEDIAISPKAVQNMVDAGMALMTKWKSEMELVCSSHLNLEHILSKNSAVLH